MALSLIFVKNKIGPRYSRCVQLTSGNSRMVKVCSEKWKPFVFSILVPIERHAKTVELGKLLILFLISL